MLDSRRNGTWREVLARRGVYKLQPADQIWIMVHFCEGAWRVVFTCLNGWEKKIYRKIVFCDKWKLHEIHIPLFINRVLLEYRHAYSFTCFWLLSRCKDRVEQFQQRPHVLQSLKNVLFGLWQKKFADPWVKEKLGRCGLLTVKPTAGRVRVTSSWEGVEGKVSWSRSVGLLLFREQRQVGECVKRIGKYV